MKIKRPDGVPSGLHITVPVGGHITITHLGAVLRVYHGGNKGTATRFTIEGSRDFKIDHGQKPKEKANVESC